MNNKSLQSKQSRKRIFTYILITFTLAIASYAFIALGREEGGGLGPWAILLQWAPAIGAFATLLIYQRNVRGLGFGLGKGRYLVLSYFLPLAVLLVTYAVIWLLGLGGFDSETVLKETEASLGISSPILLMLANIVVTGPAGVLFAAIFALGEEIGWRGFLVPELAITRSFTGVALISGVIWALFHFPFVFIFGGERAGTPIPYQLLVMTIQAIAISTIVAWIRLMSGSLWTAVIFHSVLNPFGQGLFTNLTTNTGITPYIAGEQGLALAITWSIVAIMFWLKRDSLPQFQSQDDALVSEALDSEVQPNSV